LVGSGVQNEEETAGAADAPDFIAGGVLSEIGDARTDGDFGDGLEGDEIDDGDGAVGGRGVGVHVEVGTEEGGAMLTEEHDRGGDEKDDEQEIDAEALGVGHWVIGFYMRDKGERKLRGAMSGQEACQGLVILLRMA
jgi:hypothetical protein